MYKSYSYDNMPLPVEPRSEAKSPAPPTKPEPVQKKALSLLPAPFDSMETDDLILLLVVVILIFNECDDKLLLLALAYIFFADKIGDKLK